MVMPHRTSHIWADIVSGKKVFAFEFLVVKIFLGYAQFKLKNDPASLPQLADELYNIFEKNEKLPSAEKDLQKLQPKKENIDLQVHKTLQLIETKNELEEQLQLRTEELKRTKEELFASDMEVCKMLLKVEEVFEELKQAQRQLLQSERMASIGQLAAGVAHEINNPIGFINNNMEILAQYIQDFTKVFQIIETLKQPVNDGDLDKVRAILNQLETFEQEIDFNYIINDVNGLLGQSIRGLERVKKIVLDLKTFSRQENSERMESIKIEEVIDSILSIVQSELKYKVVLTKEYGQTPLIKCNPERIGQVLINLLINASQAITDKGEIKIKTYSQEGYLIVDIADTGRGIPPENLKKIFDPFFTTKPVGQGTGLGLSVSYEIVKKHQGDIAVKSKVGEGSTFTVRLPYK
jgi:signal transduction histidine kinase